MRSKTLALVSTRYQSLSTRPLDEPVTLDTAVQALDAPRTPPHLSPVPHIAAPEQPLPQWRSDELLGSADEALISHGDQVYRLRRTTTGKLILTK